MTSTQHSQRHSSERNPGRVPDLRDRDLPQLVLAGRPVAPCPRRRRGLARRVGRQRGGVGVLGRASKAFRSAIASLLHAEADDVAVTTSVSQGVSAIVSALALDGERSRIVISEYEFPTVGQIAHAQELRGAEVVHVMPEPDGSIPAERFIEAIDERTALVCCTTLSYRSGHRHDVAAIAEAAHAAGALVLADSYQACGAVELDVRSLGADMVTGGTVKYLLGSAGLGFMWVRPEVRATLFPTQTGWFADEDIFAMSIADYSPHASARRFDSGTPPVPSLYAGVAGI